MTMKDAVIRILTVLLLAGCSEDRTDAGEVNVLSGTLTLKLAEVVPAGRPVVFELTITNTGQTAFHYWCGGPELYPDAAAFRAELKNSSGRKIESPLSNGQYDQGSGGDQPIPPATSVMLPCVMNALPIGTWQVGVVGDQDGYLKEGKTVITWPSLKAEKTKSVLVRDDPELVAEYDKGLLSEIRKGNPFAVHVAKQYGLTHLLLPLLDDLLLDDADQAFRAAAALYPGNTLPADAGDKVALALQKHMRTKTVSDVSANLLVYLALLAGTAGGDEALSAVIELAKSDHFSEIRGRAAQVLGQFSEPRARIALHTLLQDGNQRVRWEAAAVLARAGDNAALPILIDIAQDPQSQWREYVYTSLASFEDDPVAEKAIRAGLKDRDQRVREEAERALKQINRNREQKRQDNSQQSDPR